MERYTYGNKRPYCALWCLFNFEEEVKKTPKLYAIILTLQVYTA